MIKILKEGFGTNQVNSLVPKILNVLERKIGKKLFYSVVPINFSNTEGFHSGSYCLIEPDMALRLNWKIGIEHSAIESVDIWYGVQEIPDINIDVTGLNIIQIINIIDKALKSKPADLLDGKVDLEELESVKENIISNIKEKDMPEPIIKRGRGRPRKGTTDKVVMDQKSKDRILKSFQIPTSDKYKQIFAFIDMIMKGTFKLLIVCGRAGVGKSTQIFSLLKNKNIDYVPLSGEGKNVTELYKFLFAYRDQECIVLDDFDSALRDKKAVNIFKAATDISSAKDNVITMLNPKFIDPQEYVKLTKNKKLNPFRYISNSFIFRSRLIVITNLSIHQIDPAILSRALAVDLSITEDEIYKSIVANIDTFPPFETEKKFKLAALALLKPYITDITNFDFRDYEKCVALASSGAPNWKAWAMNQILATK